MSDETLLKEAHELIEKLLDGKSPVEQACILRRCLEFHAFAHPWADGDLVDSILGNIAREYSLDYNEGGVDENDDEENDDE